MLKAKITVLFVAVFVTLWGFFYLWNTRVQEHTLVENLKHQAEGIYHTVLLTRHWISEKNGIYVKDKETYRLITPSHFVAKLTHYAQKQSALPYYIKIAVQNPKNLHHTPDSFEKKALKQLENGKESVWSIEKRNGHLLFRFAAPLKFKSECTNCHSNMREKKTGCISIWFPVDAAFKELRHSKAYMFGYTVLSVGAILLVLLFWIHRLVIKPLNTFRDAISEIEKGNYDIKVDINSNDEWGVFAKHFNIMIQTINSHQKELETKVKEATQKLQKVYEEFFANITHDLKTPITAIKGAADILARKEEGEPYTSIIRKNINRLSLLIDDIIECTKLESGSLELNLEVIDLVDLITEVIFSVKPLADEKGVRITCRTTKDEILIKADPTKLYRTIANILDNALKFSPENGEIEIDVYEVDDYVQVEVKDQGPGIPSQYRNLVFNKFFKDKNSKGLGLGLTIAKAVVEAHGGRIEITSDSKGTKVVIKLPRNRYEA